MKIISLSVICLFFIQIVCAAENREQKIQEGYDLYNKYLKNVFDNMPATELSNQRTLYEWIKLFRRDAKSFVNKMSKTYPKSEAFLHSEKFKEIAPKMKFFLASCATDSFDLICDELIKKDRLDHRAPKNVVSNTKEDLQQQINDLTSELAACRESLENFQKNIDQKDRFSSKPNTINNVLDKMSEKGDKTIH